MIPEPQEIVRLASDARMPKLGFGTWKLQEGRETREAVAKALEIGYRHVDTAAAYGNEKSVGDAIRDSQTPREDIFLTTKVWNDDIRAGATAVRRALDNSLRKLGAEYVDLYLLHWPTGAADSEAWRTLEELHREGRARAIGVCNYQPHHLDRLLTTAEIPPMVNQVEFHPRFNQRPLRTYCREHAIILEAWAPLMKGRVGEVEEIAAMAKRHGKTPAQVVLRWDLQHNIPAIPKSARPERIAENAAIFDFTLSAEEMAEIDGLA